MLSTKIRNADRSIGAILVDAGRLDPASIERILRHQVGTELRFGEAGLQLGLLTEADILYALSLQFDYPYLQPGGSVPISPEVVVAYKPFSVEGERFRSLRSQLQLQWFDEGSRQTALAVVSATRGEGKSNLTANLAVTFAQLGQRTLVIDADLRTPRQHKLFKIDNQIGLSSLLAGRMQDQVVSFVHGIPGLAILPSGPTPPNPAELLSRPNLARILEQSQSSFDVVLLDTGAFDRGADAALVSRAARAAVVVARKDITRSADFHTMVAAMGDLGARVIGSVLVEVSARADSGDRDA